MPIPLVEMIVFVVSLIWLWIFIGWLSSKDDE